MASRAEVAAVTAYLSAAVAKPMTAEQVEVYCDVLKVFDADVLRNAVREVVRHHVYPTLPTPGAVYEAACVIWRKQQQQARLAYDVPKGTRLLSDDLRLQLRLNRIGLLPGERE